MAQAKNRITKRVLNTKSLGKSWGKILQNMVTKEAATQARALLKSGKRTAKDEEEVEVRIPVVLHLTFARRGTGIGGDHIQCACIFKQDPNGSSVCICTGPGAAECDCGMIVV